MFSAANQWLAGQREQEDTRGVSGCHSMTEESSPALSDEPHGAIAIDSAPSATA
jgi:hypothetical protein